MLITSQPILLNHLLSATVEISVPGWQPRYLFRGLLFQVFAHLNCNFSKLGAVRMSRAYMLGYRPVVKCVFTSCCPVDKLIADNEISRLYIGSETSWGCGSQYFFYSKLFHSVEICSVRYHMRRKLMVFCRGGAKKLFFCLHRLQLQFCRLVFRKEFPFLFLQHFKKRIKTWTAKNANISFIIHCKPPEKFILI